MGISIRVRFPSRLTSDHLTKNSNQASRGVQSREHAEHHVAGWREYSMGCWRNRDAVRTKAGRLGGPSPTRGRWASSNSPVLSFCCSSSGSGCSSHGKLHCRCIRPSAHVPFVPAPGGASRGSNGPLGTEAHSPFALGSPRHLQVPMYLRSYSRRPYEPAKRLEMRGTFLIRKQIAIYGRRIAYLLSDEAVSHSPYSRALPLLRQLTKRANACFYRGSDRS